MANLSPLPLPSCCLPIYHCRMNISLPCKTSFHFSRSLALAAIAAALLFTASSFSVPPKNPPATAEDAIEQGDEADLGEALSLAAAGKAKEARPRHRSFGMQNAWLVVSGQCAAGGRAALVAADGQIKCCQCENVANCQFQLPMKCGCRVGRGVPPSRPALV